ncbi:ABC transporter substrate-binding protein [bacterium]|nr:MAG: ABC transporter substrate-binding protein [bacterium]
MERRENGPKDARLAARLDSRRTARRNIAMNAKRAKMPLAMLALALMSGCDSTPADGGNGPIVLQFWNGFSGPDGKTMEKIVSEFNASHKDVQVKMQIIPWGTFYDKVTLGLAFGGAPDLFILHANRIPEYASNDSLATYDPEIQAGEFPVDDFKPRQWEGGQYGGKQIGIPLDCHPLTLYYNKKLFREAGIANPPTNWEEFIAAGKKLTMDKRNADGKPYKQWGFNFTHLPNNVPSFLNQHNASFLTPDLSKGAMTSPEMKVAVDQMISIWKNYGIAPRPEGQDAWLGFLTGKVAMAMEGIYMKSGLDNQKDLEYAAAPVPMFGPKRAVWAGSHMMCMPATEPEARRKASIVFIKYLSDHSLSWAEGGQVPVRKSILESEGFQKLSVQREAAKQLDYVQYEPSTPSWNQLATFGNSAMEACLNELEPEGAALETAQRRIDRVLAREKAR